MKYPIHVELDTNGQYLVTFPDILEAATAADTREEALVLAVDALESALDFYFDEKRLVPLPSKVEHGQLFVHLSAETQARLGKPVGKSARALRIERLAGWK